MQRSDRHKRKDPTKPRARARCSCGKAIYRNAHDAGRDLDRFGLARMYRCDEGRLHLTSGEQDDPPGAYARKRPTPALLTRCPACGALAVWDDATSCAHPVHSRRSAANRARVPYFPVRVAIIGQLAPLAAGERVAAALRDAGVAPSVVDTFRADFGEADNHAAALDCAQRWVSVG
jgi:hypothetical protein